MVSLIALLLAAGADSPVPATLLREPVRLEIVADGSVETPADRFRLSGMLLARGKTVAAAMAERDARRSAITRDMAALGVTVSPPSDHPQLLGFIGNEQYADGEGAEAQEPATIPDRLRFDAPDRATADRAIELLKKDGVTAPGSVGILIDDSAAVDAARADALRGAYAKAQRSAAALGLRVAALRQISDQPHGTDRDLAQMAQSLGFGDPTAKTVRTTVSLTVVFELSRQP